MKKLFLGIFALLPKKLYTFYILLCLYVFIRKVKDNNVDENSIDITQLSDILNMTLNKEVIIFPLATYNWIWSEEIIYIKVHTCKCNEANEKTLYEVIKQKELLLNYIDDIVYRLINSLPDTTKRALKLEKDVVSLIKLEKLFKNVVLAAAN